MQVIIRTDASIQIGSGHVMRCLTLAKQLKKNDIKVTFITRDLYGNLNEFIRSQGFEVFELSSIERITHWEWSTDHWLEDVNETISVIKVMKQSIDMIIVDHYSIDIKWEQQIRSFTKKIMVIDDLANRKHDCDLLLDQNFYLDLDNRYDELVPSNCKLLLGPKYVLLREEFLYWISKMPPRNSKVKNILVFFGGTDPTNETEKTLHAIKMLAHTYTFNTDVVVGTTNPQKILIEKLCSEIPRTNFYCQVNNMAELMTKADLAIGAGGGATWERCILKLPTLTIIVADNQEQVSMDVAKMGASILLGKSSFVKSLNISMTIEKLIKEPQIILDLSNKCGELMETRHILNNSLVKEIVKTCNT
ncbi:UDP-2,4-diacetamido-2,4,6-trideoxy-beta-L-altropyranose hydrolase [Bacillus sp. Cr_A10]|uniref:UDP-2,4-diacetamido-2,4, 6-trideoxy-beta-L-altropyranose hydrolase n=1 Tax=Bacillus sp. Cr_A10 TaxID=3033993 RepID=UPI0023DB58F6|nr:UDP-2,4-diacetamido-2,4,6-trideoxy-beta-L-altropyranose hydrolase [Bacillus sp. Cr_A10]MDF2065815.1 UDP-2,4-diacetamido-2,4,6-trideoxy-beta-L-altropyranose hydrolase [Bacillus sp. Cr_A10]